MHEHVFSSVDFVAQCLLDRRRIDAFALVIRRVVKPGASVIDLGTGSGIFALLAARYGAGSVVAVEIDPYLVRIAAANVKRNGYDRRIRVVHDDARTLMLGKGSHVPHFDVVIIEMLTAGLIDEHQIHAINNLHRRGYVNHTTKFVPYAQETYAALAEMSFDYVKGVKVRMPIHIWKWYPKGLLNVKRLTGHTLLEVTHFSRRSDESIVQRMEFKVVKSGMLNSVIISSRTFVSQRLTLRDTLSLNAPVVVPLEQEIRVTRGERVRAEIAYDFGKGYKSFKATIHDR